MKEFTMTVRTTTEEGVTTDEQYYLSAEGVQKVKYWYHATQKGPNNFTDAEQGGKHTLVGEKDQITELLNIRELNYAEAPVLREHLQPWPKQSTDNTNGSEGDDSDN